MTRRSKSGNKYKSRVNAERRWASSLLPGERLIANWCCDSAPCGCPPTHRFSMIPCISIAQTDEYQRCLMCEARWTPREYRWQPVTMIKRPRSAARRAA